jgi:serine protease Do
MHGDGIMPRCFGVGWLVRKAGPMMPMKQIVPLAVAVLLLSGVAACNGGRKSGVTVSLTPPAASPGAVSQLTPTAAILSQGAAPGTPPGDIAADLVQTVQKSVVKVSASALVRVIPFGRVVTQESVGTGFVVDARGYIATNFHVISFDGAQSAPRVQVQTWDGRVFDATVIGTDRNTDLAVLRIAASDLPALRFADPASVRVGQMVVAIGYALDLGATPTVTMGVISAKDRVIEEETARISGALQTDAAINPGNSGGPLLNLRGEVVGINTAGFVGVGQSVQGIFFAISAQVGQPVIDRLIAGRPSD